MIKKGTRLSLFLTAVLGFLSISVGHAAFQTGENGASDSYDGQVTLRKPVCYISGSPNVYYPSIEKALEVAKNTSGSQTVYVIPGANPTIQSDCTIASGDSLVLPYADDGTTHSIELFNSYDAACSSSVFGDSNPSAYRKSQVILAEGVTLTNEGTLTIGGIQGWNGMNPTGQTVNQYAEITMSTGSQIVNSGTLNCYGYIKDAKDATGTLITHGNASNLLTPLVIYDYRGGSYSTWAVGGLSPFRGWKTMPFNVFDIPNIQSETLINSGCLWQVMMKLPLNDVTTTTAALLGTSSSAALIRLNSGTVTYKYHAPKGYSYDDFQKSVTAETANITTFTVDGNVSISSMKMDIGVSIDTSEFMLPFSYKFHFLFNSGSSVVSNKVKFLGGSYVEIGKNATVTLQANTLAYQNYVPPIITGRTNAAYWPSYATSATIVNNGTLSIASGFGGIVQSTSEGAILKTVSGYSSSATETEATSGETGGLKGGSDPHSETARFTLLDLKRVVDGSETVYEYGKVSSARFEETIGSSSSYTSKHILDHTDYGWLGSGSISNTLYRIRYSLGISSASMPTGYVNQFPSYATETVLSKPVSSDDRYVFEGLYYDSAFTASKKLSIDGNGNPVLDVATALSLLNGSNYLTLYAKWIDTTMETYTLKTITKMTTDHLQIETQTSEVPGIVEEGVSLNGSVSNFIVIASTSVSNGTGTVTPYVFDGYDVTIKDSSNTTKQTIRVQANGSDSNGYFSGFSMDGTTADALLANGDILTATAVYATETISYDFNISFGATTINTKDYTNASINAAANSNAISALSEFGISTTYSWTTSLGKLKIESPSSSSTKLTNQHRGSNTKQDNGTVTCVVTAGEIQLASFTQAITLMKGRLE